MVIKDLFGLKREEKIKASGVRDIFTPHRPINKIEFFFGRQREVKSIIEQLNTPGQHSLLYGERGVGKSSLANIASQVLLKELVKGTLYIKPCDSSTTFESILEKPLKDAGVDIKIRQIESKQIRGKALSGGISFAKGECRSGDEISETRDGPAEYLSPSLAAGALKDNKGLLVIDEADRLRDPFDKKRLAEFIKLLSDSDAKFKVLIVGVAETGGELIETHESVGRCLRETRLGRMKDDELLLIIKEGAKKLKINFEDDVIAKIVELSAGYPHFTHLLALKCAEEAIADGFSHIGVENLKNAMHSAVDDAEGSLKRTYDSAVRSSGTTMYETILRAAANLNKTEFSAEELRRKIKDLISQDILQQSLNNYFKRLVSDDSSTILRRTAKGVYRFNDPRMQSYIRIATEE